jgi:hypothetical protein
MKTLDIFKTKTSQKLNETLEKTFGKKLKLETFSIEQLHDVRNKLRTQIHQFKQSSSFNETVENETYTKAQWMLDTVNAAIAERGEFTADPHQAEIDEGFGSLEEKVAEIIKKFDEDMMEIGGYGDPDQDKIVELLRQGDVEGATEVVWYAYADQDGGELRDMDRYIESLEDEFKELADGDFDRDPDEGGDTDDSYALASAGHGSDEDYGDFGRDESFKTNEDTQGEDMRKVTEGEIQQAQSIVTAKTMVDRVGRWIEELSGMENDTLLTLGDQIRDEMGQEQAKAFLSACAPAIQQALENLKQTRETLATGVRTLTGEQQPAEIIGADPAAAPADDVAGPAEPDAMNAEPDLDAEGGDLGDEFGASEPATGGAEETGRAKRESINYSNKLLKVLAG